jgi:hypothetical protein
VAAPDPSEGAPSAEPKDAKLETWTRVRVDSQVGHTWARSRSANEVSTSNWDEHFSQLYS